MKENWKHLSDMEAIEESPELSNFLYVDENIVTVKYLTEHDILQNVRKCKKDNTKLVMKVIIKGA